MIIIIISVTNLKFKEFVICFIAQNKYHTILRKCSCLMRDTNGKTVIKLNSRQNHCWFTTYVYFNNKKISNFSPKLIY